MPEYQAQITTTGSAGAATGTATFLNVHGLIYAVNVNYSGSAPATTDITVTYSWSNTKTTNIVTLTDVNTDTTIYPVVEETDSAGTGVLTTRLHMVANGDIVISIAGCDALAIAADISIQIL